jgi:hypothetical protein
MLPRKAWNCSSVMFFKDYFPENYLLLECNAVYLDTKVSEEPAASILSPEDGSSKFLLNVGTLTKLHSITYQKKAIIIVSTVGTSSLVHFFSSP